MGGRLSIERDGRPVTNVRNIQPGFASGKKGKGLLRRFKVRMHAVDSPVMELVANGIGWAKHRRREAAAKVHLRLDNLMSCIPSNDLTPARP